MTFSPSPRIHKRNQFLHVSQKLVATFSFCALVGLQVGNAFGNGEELPGIIASQIAAQELYLRAERGNRSLEQFGGVIEGETVSAGNLKLALPLHHKRQELSFPVCDARAFIPVFRQQVSGVGGDHAAADSGADHASSFNPWIEFVQFFISGFIGGVVSIITMKFLNRKEKK